MKIIKQIFIILLFYVFGELISLGVSSIFNHIFIPGTIIGMLLLLAFLLTKKIKTECVDEVGTFLTNNMAFFFIPAAVSVIEYFDILKIAFVKIIIISLISIIITFFFVAYSVKLTVSLQNKYLRKLGEKHE